MTQRNVINRIPVARRIPESINIPNVPGLSRDDLPAITWSTGFPNITAYLDRFRRELPSFGLLDAIPKAVMEAMRPTLEAMFKKLVYDPLKDIAWALVKKGVKDGWNGPARAGIARMWNRLAKTLNERLWPKIEYLYHMIARILNDAMVALTNWANRVIEFFNKVWASLVSYFDRFAENLDWIKRSFRKINDVWNVVRQIYFVLFKLKLVKSPLKEEGAAPETSQLQVSGVL